MEVVNKRDWWVRQLGMKDGNANVLVSGVLFLNMFDIPGFASMTAHDWIHNTFYVCFKLSFYTVSFFIYFPSRFKTTTGWLYIIYTVYYVYHHCFLSCFHPQRHSRSSFSPNIVALSCRDQGFHQSRGRCVSFVEPLSNM